MDLVENVILENITVESNNFYGGECYFSVLAKSFSIVSSIFELNGLANQAYPEDEVLMEASEENELSLLLISRCLADEDLSITLTDVSCVKNRALLSACVWIDEKSSISITSNSLTIDSSSFEFNIAEKAALLYTIDPLFDFYIYNTNSLHNLNKGY